MRYSAELRSVPLGVVVKLEQRDGQKLHILRHAQHAAVRQFQQVQFLALFGSGAMRRQVRVHEGFVIGSIPLSERGVDCPIILG